MILVDYILKIFGQMNNYCIYCENYGDRYFCGMYCINGDGYKPRERIIKMKLTNINQIHSFLSIVDSCNGDVWLESKEGDKFNLKSPLSQYVAIGALLSNHGEDLELYCGDRKDESKFFEFFESNPEAL